MAGGIAGGVTSEAGGVPEGIGVRFFDSDQRDAGPAYGIEADGTYDERSLWAGTYTVQFRAFDHAAEWWQDATAEGATTVTVKPGQVVTGISAALSKEAKAIERPVVTGDAWVGKTLTLGNGLVELRVRLEVHLRVARRHRRRGHGTDPDAHVGAHLGQQVVGRVTNDAGFAVGQAVSEVDAARWATN